MESENKYDSMIILLKKVYYTSSASPEKKHDYLEKLVLAYLDNQDNVNASAAALKLVKILENHNARPEQLSRAYVYKSEAEFKLHNIETANIYALKGYALDCKLKDTVRVLKSLIRLGIFSTSSKQYKKALTYYTDAKKIKTNDPLLNYYLYNALTVVFNEISQYDSSLWYSKKTLHVSKKLLPLNNTNIVRALCNVANQFSQLDKFNTALHYLDSIRSYATADDVPSDLLNSIYFNYYIAHFNLKQYDSGNFYLQKYIELTEKTLEQKRQTEITEFAEMHKREKQHLAENQEARIEVLKLERIILAIAIILLVAIGAVIYYLHIRSRKNARIKKDKVRIEQRLLRAQMNPHFILNTLNVIQVLVEDNQKERATKYLNSFSSLMHTTLLHSSENFISLKDELKALDQYLCLQLMRFENEFDYTIEDTMDCHGALIPPMVLQPFVENAIHHGIRNLDRKGKVSIRIKSLPNAIECSIDDNGRGLLLPVKPTAKQSLSTQIIRKRLEILKLELKKEVTLRVIDKKEKNGQGVRVTITLPFISNELNDVGSKHTLTPQPLI